MRPSGRTVLLQVFQNLLRMGSRVQLRVDLLNHPLGINDIRDPLGGRRRRLVAGPVGQADRPRGVAQAGKVEVELASECGVCLDGVETDPKDLDALGLELRDAVAEPATLGRSARCVRLGIEPQHHRLTPEVLEAHGAARMVLKSEVWSWLPDIEHGASWSRIIGPWLEPRVTPGITHGGGRSQEYRRSKARRGPSHCRSVGRHFLAEGTVAPL